MVRQVLVLVEVDGGFMVVFGSVVDWLIVDLLVVIGGRLRSCCRDVQCRECRSLWRSGQYCV